MKSDTSINPPKWTFEKMMNRNTMNRTDDTYESNPHYRSINTSDSQRALDEILLYITTIPAGGGNCFLGYLQRVFNGNCPKLKWEDFPEKNCWDEVTGHGIWNWAMYQMNKKDLNVTEEPPKIDIIKSFGESAHTNSNNPWLLPFSVRSQELYANMGKVSTSQKYWKAIQGDYSTTFFAHEFPYGVQKQWKNIKHSLSIEGDLDTHRYMFKLQQLKTNPTPFYDEYYVTKLHENQVKSNKEFPPETSINYNKFFIEQDVDEIRKFLKNTLDIQEEDITWPKLIPVLNMIEIYNLYNEQLIKKYEEVFNEIK